MEVSSEELLFPGVGVTSFSELVDKWEQPGGGNKDALRQWVRTQRLSRPLSFRGSKDDLDALSIYVEGILRTFYWEQG